jgi:hypothetical protein
MSRPIRILALADNFVPERNAPALRVHEHCRRWAEQGAEVTVITCAPNFPTGKVFQPYENCLYQRERMDGIEVVRVWSYLAPNAGVFRRSLDFLSYAVSAFFAGLRESPDIIVATSPQLLTGVAGAMLAFVKRRPWVFEVRDLWPDSITAVGAMPHGRLITLLRWIEGRLYRSARLIVVTSHGLRDAIVGKGVPAKKIVVVHNGANMKRFLQASVDDLVAARLGLTGKFVVGYVGTHGLAQGLETLIAAADRLKEKADIHFVFVGEGARRAALVEMVRARGMANVTLVGAVPAAVVPSYLAMCNAVAVPLRKSDISPGAIPSKIFDAAAMSRPILLSVFGLSATLVQDYQAGLVIEPENPEAFAAAVLQLKENPQACEQYALGARNIARDFDRDMLADAMLAEIKAAL